MSDIYLGNTEIEKAYIGDTLIYEKGGGDNSDDNRWYFVVGGYSSTNTEDMYVTRIYLLPWNGGRWVANTHGINNGAYNFNCWFEYKGEKYFVDSFSDGTHTLSKQGSPVKCTISDFMELYIEESDGVYTVFYAED